MECVCQSQEAKLWARGAPLAANPAAAEAGDFVFLSVRAAETSSDDGIRAALTAAVRWRGVYSVVGAGHPHGDVHKTRLILRHLHAALPSSLFSHPGLSAHHAISYSQRDNAWVSESKQTDDREYALARLVSKVNELLLSHAALQLEVADLKGDIAQLRQQVGSAAREEGAQ